MRKVLNWILSKGVIALAALLLIGGVASAQTTVTGVQKNATYGNGNTEITIDGTIQCANIDDVVTFEAVQNQGRYHAVGYLEFVCSAVENIDIPTVHVFTGQKLRPGPFSLLIRFYDPITGAFISGEGHELRGK